MQPSTSARGYLPPSISYSRKHGQPEIPPFHVCRLVLSSVAYCCPDHTSRYHTKYLTCVLSPTPEAHRIATNKVYMVPNSTRTERLLLEVEKGSAVEGQGKAQPFDK